MNLNNLKTLIGLLMPDLVKKLDEELPGEAYSAVPGVANLTDIDPNWMRKVFNEIFGICGIGWGYRYDPVDLHVTQETRPRSSGGTRNVYIASLRRLTFWYKIVDEQGVMTTCEIEASGGSENEVEGYAMKGAITNALGNSASNLGFQESVYLGRRSHKTVGKSKPAPGPAPAKPAEAKSAAQPGPKPAAISAAKPSAAAKKPAPAVPVPAVPVPHDPTVFVVPQGCGPSVGKTLEEIYKGESGRKTLEIFSKLATGGDPSKESLKNAAIAFLAKNNGHVPQSVAA